MPTLLRDCHPVARKEHKCMFCDGVIHPKETYRRTTLKYDGDLYDWVTHLQCAKVANLLCMYDDCDDEGLGDEGFKENIWAYLNDYYRDEETDDLPESIASMSYMDQVNMILRDYDLPHIKKKRLKYKINYCETFGRSLKEWEIKYLNELREELNNLESGNEEI